MLLQKDLVTSSGGPLDFWPNETAGQLIFKEWNQSIQPKKLYYFTLWSNLQSQSCSTLTGSSGGAADPCVLAFWWSVRCNLDPPAASQSVRVVRQRQLAGCAPSAQGQGQDPGQNSLQGWHKKRKHRTGWFRYKARWLQYCRFVWLFRDISFFLSFSAQTQSHKRIYVSSGEIQRKYYLLH